MKKVAIYVRVSTLEQAESGYSIGEQIAKLEKYCDLHDYVIYETYKDGGFSGSNIDRPAITQLIQHANEKRFEAVIVYKLDRLSRSQKDTLYLIEDVFLKNNIDFMSMNENFDTSSAFGKAMIGILSVFAQLEREQIRERMQLGKLGRAKSGKAMNWVKPPLGYDLIEDKLVINDFQANIVRRVFSEYIGGLSKSKLMEKLNDEGHLGKAKPWSKTTLTQVLKNKTYIGLVNYKDQYFQGNHEAIISIEDFNKAQYIMEKRQRALGGKRPYEGRHILTSVLRCAKCGAGMEIKASNAMIEKGTERYACLNKKRTKKMKTPPKAHQICDSVTLRRTDLEEAVLNEISLVQNDQEYYKSLHTEEKNTFDEKGAKKELLAIEKKIKKLNDLYLNDLITLENLKDQTADLKNTKQTILEQIENNHEETPALNITQIPNIFTLTKEEQKNVISTFISSVDVDESTLQIHWTF